MTNVQISNEITVIQIIMDRVEVLADDLRQDYFKENYYDEDNLELKIGYHAAAVKAYMIADMITDVVDSLKELQDNL